MFVNKVIVHNYVLSHKLVFDNVVLPRQNTRFEIHDGNSLGKGMVGLHACGVTNI